MLLDVCRRQWDALRRVDRFRREGVSNLSHDLRSPLTATVACLETLDARWSAAAIASGDDRADDRHLVEIALRNTRNAARMVRSLGDLAKLDEPAFEVRRDAVDLSELLDDIALRFAERATHAGIDLRTRSDEGSPRAMPMANVDIELIERAVANLVDNALKYARRGATVVLSATRRGGAVDIAVADDGPGVAVDDLPHLFDRFYQSRTNGPTPAGAEPGSGLGLAIVRRIAELHGGRVAATAGEAGGTVVTLHIPADGALSA